MSKIACFGGSFNPPHIGHLKIALSVLREEKFDEVWFLPTISTPLKATPMVAFEDRVQMLTLLIKPYRKLRICTIEAQLPSPNYTINTVNKLNEIYPEYDFTWIIGSDQANQFSEWKNADKLLEMIKFIVVVRNPEDTFEKSMKTLWVKNIDQISSSKIRNGKLTDTTKPIIDYIFKHELYLESIARSMVSELRWQHVKNVEELALQLGEIHHLELHQVKVAALFHDCTKRWHKPFAAQWLSFVDPNYLSQAPAIWHQKTAAAYLKRIGLKDKTILQAIGHHVTGKQGHALTQVIYIADKCEPGRDYDVTEILNLAKIDLDKAADLVSTQQMDYIQKEKNAS